MRGEPVAIVGVGLALSVNLASVFPSVHFERMNPRIDPGGADVRVPTAPLSWPGADEPRLAAENSFGYSGTSACAVVREASVPAPAPARPRPHELLVLSAKAEDSLGTLADRWADYLSMVDEGRFPIECGFRHSPQDWRLAMLFRSLIGLARAAERPARRVTPGVSAAGR
jgi:acyl transferase domain-containing protein